MRARKRWPTPAVVAALLLAPTPASAFVRSTTTGGTPTAWGSVNLALTLYVGGEPPQFLSTDDVRQAARNAAATWSKPNVVCTDVNLTVNETDEAFAPAEFDRVNRIGFRRGTTLDDWRKIPCTPTPTQSCLPYPTGAIAITTVTSNSRTGEILDADMEINAVLQKFADLGPEGTRRPDLVKVHDLENTLTHEFGHVLGFDHNCYDPMANLRVPRDETGMTAPNCSSAPAITRMATMYNQAFEREVAKRTLEPDDLKAVCETYPRGYRNMFASDDEGGCAVAPHGRSGAAAGMLGALALAATISVRVSRRRRRR